MTNRIVEEERIDPRIRQAYSELGEIMWPTVGSREELLALGKEALGWVGAFGDFDPAPYEAAVPFDGLTIRRQSIPSQPDGNSINLEIVAPEGEGPFPCVYYIHGGGMMMSSGFDPNYRAFARLIAANGIAVILVDYRNSFVPSSVPEVAPFPAGLNDCVSGLRWVHGHASELNIDPGRIVVAGESGGGNLSLATALKLGREGDFGLISGVYAMCPFIAGQWQGGEGSSIERNAGFLIDQRNNNTQQMAYGIETLRNRDPLAWPTCASEEDVIGFPPTIIRVNEFDQLLDEGVEFYRLLLRAGVNARCTQVMGTVHGIEVAILPCPDISRDAAREIAALCKGD